MPPHGRRSQRCCEFTVDREVEKLDAFCDLLACSMEIQAPEARLRQSALAKVIDGC